VKKIESDNEEKKEFVMPDAYCCGCKKLLRLKPMTLYVKCGLCDTISQIIRKDGGYITAPYKKNKKLRATLLDSEEPTKFENYIREAVENEIKLRRNLDIIVGMAELKISMFAMVVAEEAKRQVFGDNTATNMPIMKDEADFSERIKKIDIKLLISSNSKTDEQFEITDPERPTDHLPDNDSEE
jgi:LSD1 subclass zinc finger protein